MSTTGMSKEAFKEFSKIVLYCCNYSKRKVYMRHLKFMMGYYLIKIKNNSLIESKIGSDSVDIKFFEKYLQIMQEIGFIEFDNNFYGTIVIAKKKLEKKAYEEYQIQILQEAIEKSLDDLQDIISIAPLYSQDNGMGDMI